MFVNVKNFTQPFIHESRVRKVFLALIKTSGYCNSAYFTSMMHTAESDSAVGCTPRSFFKIRISRRNRNRIRKYFSLFIRGLDGFESWKKWRSKISWRTPFKQLLSFSDGRAVWGESTYSNSFAFYNFCTRQFMQFSLFWSHYLFFLYQFLGILPWGYI